ncbi:hypothetical protein ACIQ6R_36370 [Streptomyces sp. NPDC096048]|uniref:hypothetical protein n=1 Tax=Streptomyces sp. NPDC096048 TaxID=3366072 RepID=UPI00380F832D
MRIRRTVTAAATTVAVAALGLAAAVPAQAAEYSSALKIKGVQYDAPGRDSSKCSGGNTAAHRRLDSLRDQDFIPGGAAVGRIVTTVPVAQSITVVAVTGLGIDRQAGDGFGDGERLGRVGGWRGRGDGQGSEERGDQARSTEVTMCR